MKKISLIGRLFFDFRGRLSCEGKTMSITWKFEILRISKPNGNGVIEQSMQFEADTIRESKEKAGDKIEQNEILSTMDLNLDWTILRDRERNFTNVIVRVYHRGEDERDPLEFPESDFPSLPERYVTIEPLGMPLSEISDYAEHI